MRYQENSEIKREYQKRSSKKRGNMLRMLARLRISFNK